MLASSPLAPSVASTMKSTMSASSIFLRAMTTESFSAISRVLPLRRMPAVSMKRILRPLYWMTSSIESRVVPAIGETIARDSSRELIQQRGFADIGVPDDSHLDFMRLLGSWCGLPWAFPRDLSDLGGCLCTSQAAPEGWRRADRQRRAHAQPKSETYSASRAHETRRAIHPACPSPSC